MSYYLEKSVPQRMFLPDDVIQIQVINEMPGTTNYCIHVKPIDLPLSTNGTYTHFVQLGETSQIKLLLGLSQSQKLVEEQSKLRLKKLGQQEQGTEKGTAAVTPEEI